jgi:hypothetical protein
MYLPVHCLGRVEVEDISVVARVHERLRAMGGREAGVWNAALALLQSEMSPGGPSSIQRYLRVTDDSLGDPLIMHGSSHVPLMGQIEALQSFLHVQSKTLAALKGKRWAVVDAEETDWEIGIATPVGAMSSKNVLFLSLQLSATRSRTAAPLWIFQRMYREILGADLAAKVTYFSHQQHAAVSPLVASTMYNRAHLTLQYITMMQTDLRK